MISVTRSEPSGSFFFLPLCHLPFYILRPDAYKTLRELVPLTDRLALHAGCLSHSELLTLGDKWGGQEDYLSTQWNGRLMDPATPYSKFKKVIRMHNEKITADKSIPAKEKDHLLLPDIPLHGLRHTSATLLLSEGTDVVTVAKRLGHAKASTTLDIYAHALAKNDETASFTLDKLLPLKKA